MTITTTPGELLALSDVDLTRLESIIRRFDCPAMAIQPNATENTPRANNEEREARDAYALQFGISFRQCKGRPTDSPSIVKAIRDCMAAGLTAKEFFNDDTKPFGIADTKPMEEPPDDAELY